MSSEGSGSENQSNSGSDDDNSSVRSSERDSESGGSEHEVGAATFAAIDRDLHVLLELSEHMSMVRSRLLEKYPQYGLGDPERNNVRSPVIVEPIGKRSISIFALSRVMSCRDYNFRNKTFKPNKPCPIPALN